jgi:uncharacterized protein (UPF0147 family)
MPDDDLVSPDKMKDNDTAQLRAANKDIIVKKNKVVNSKNIPSHLKTYVHALKTGL